MLLTALWSVTAHACSEVRPVDVLDVPRPSILVLGERHGKRRDLKRAATLVRRLARDGEVTVAVEAVAATHQDALTQLTQRGIRPAEVERAADWEQTWGYDFQAYKPLFKVPGVTYVAAGPKLRKKPEDVEVSVPEEYHSKLAAVAHAHGHQTEDVSGFAASMAYRDVRIAELALAGWDGNGVLVVVVGRGHVAEGLGITWQLDHGLTDATWTSALLAPSPSCGPDDRYLP